MSRLCLCFAVLLAGVGAGLGSGGTVRGQSPKPQAVKPAMPSDPSFSPFISLPSNRPLARKLEAVADYIPAGAWQEVTTALQEVLDFPQDAFMSVQRKRSRDNDKETTVWVSLRSEANRLLGSLPASGQAAYEVLSGARAAVLLREAKQRGDPEGLAQVVQRFFYTRAGTEAADLLGTHYLDRGQYLMASSCFGRLLSRPGTQPLTLFKAALAASRIGDDAAVRLAWKQLAAKAPDGLLLGEHQASLAELQKLLRKSPEAVVKAAAADWPMFRGDAARAASGVGKAPSQERTWQKATARDATSRGWLDMAVQQLQLRGRPSLPAAFPIAVGGKIIYRSQWGIQAVAAATGEIAWESANLRGGFDNPIHIADGSKVHAELSGWVNMHLQNNPEVLLENSALGSLSSDGTNVYAVEDVAVPPYSFPQYFNRGLVVLGGGLAVNQPAPSNKKFDYNQLIALNLKTGKFDWTLGGEADPAFQNSFFFGPPLPLGGKLYSLIEKDQELRLLCLEPRDGKAKLLWAQPLANFKKNISQDMGRRIWAAPPAYAEGMLLCPTNAGVVVAVDLLSHTLLWAHSYASLPPSPPKQKVVINGKAVFMPARIQMPRLDSKYSYSAPVVADGKVLVSAPDAGSLQCLNLRDGSLIWKNDWVSGDCYLAGVFQGKVLVVSQHSCRALNLADGKPAWTTPTGVPSGQGMAVDKLYYLPLRATNQGQGPSIWALEAATGRVVERIAARTADVPGNLLFYQGQLLSQNATTVTAFSQHK